MLIDVKESGALGDGETLDWEIIQKCIDKCGKEGGGTVVFRDGKYLTGMLEMRSGVALRVEWGAVIQASKNISHFKPLKSTPMSRSGPDYALISAQGCDSIRFEGNGAFMGNGNSAFITKDKTKEEIENRPVMFLIDNCSNVSFENVHIMYSDFWNVHLKHCSDVYINGITIKTHKQRINADGIDPDGSRNVMISNCNIESGDDSIVFKSTEGVVCEHITVTNCILSSNCQAIKFGTESRGPIRNITISNCVIRDSRTALSMFLKDGGPFENILISKCTINTWGVLPFVIDISRRFFDKEEPTGNIRNVTFDTIVFTGPGRALVEGREDFTIQNFKLVNLTWDISGECPDFSQFRKHPSTSKATTDPNAPNYANKPYQFTFANVENVVVRDITINDFRDRSRRDRGAIAMYKVNNGVIDNVISCKTPQKIPSFKTDSCENIISRNIR